MSVKADVLVVARLTVRGSYSREIELPATEAFDTVQFHVRGDGVIFRIRTFALDHDIHVQQFGRPPSEALPFIEAHLDRIYGRVLASVQTVPLARGSTTDLAAAGITAGRLEMVRRPGYAFWNPDGGEYTTTSVPVAPAERQGMTQVVYLGGVARFWLPESWRVEMDVENGGRFWDPDHDAVLRLSVLTFATPDTDARPRVRHTIKPGERAVDGGRLPNGHEFDVYEWDDAAEGTRLRCWQIAQVLPGQCRIYLFTYAFPVADTAGYADELAMVDREVRRMIPYPDPIT